MAITTKCDVKQINNGFLLDFSRWNDSADIDPADAYETEKWAYTDLDEALAKLKELFSA